MVVGSRPQVGSSILIAPRRRLATAAFDQAVNVFLFIEHEHTNIVKPVGGGACCVADAGGISGSFHPCTNAPIFYTLPDRGVLQRGHVAIYCCKPKYLEVFPGMMAALV